MSNNIYDILGKLDGLTPKANPVSTAEPIYESVDPRGDIMSAVTQLEERFMGFKEAKAKRKEPSVEVPADDLTRSSDPDVVKIATKARFAKPQAKNDFEAIVSYVNKQEKELERAEQADVVDREKIEQTQGMLAKTQANQDALRKVIDNTDQRFRALNAKVASGQITQQDQKAAQAAQQIEKDADTAKAAVAKGATAPEQPTTAPEAPQDTNVYNFPDKDTKSEPEAAPANPEPELQNQPGPNEVNPLAWQAQQTVNPQNISGTTLPEPEGEKINFSEPKKKVNQRESKTNEGFWKGKDIENQENPTAQVPQTPKTPAELVATNKQQVARFDNEPKLGAVKLQYHGGESINMTRATYEKVARGLSKIGDKILKNRVETDIFSNRDQLAKYMTDIESAPGVDYYYFYNVKRGQEAKAFNLGLKQSKGGNWYNPRVPLPAAEEIFGKGVKWTPGQPAKTTAESVEESLGKNTMTKPTSIIEAVRSVEDKKLKEAAKPDFLDLDKDGDTDEPMKSAAKDAKDHEPDAPDESAVAKRKRLQALKDKQEDERAERGDDDKSASRFVKGRAYGGSAQKDDEDKDELDEGAKPDFLDVDKDGNKKEPFKKAVKDKKEVEEGIKFGDTIKNSKGKMTKVTVKEGKDAIRNHPIYTTKEAWDHYAQELAEQETMDEAVLTPVVNVQQELDEIAKLAGLPVKTCESCGCAESACKCNENLAPMAPNDSASPLTHTLEEAATRKDFRQCADTIKDIEDLEKRKEHALHYADFFKEQNPRFKREMFLAACHVDLAECGSMPSAVIVGEGDTCPTCDCAPCKCDESMMEADMEEGNEFSGALAAAKASGAKDFEVDGKKYTVKEDININVSASGEEDAVNLIRKLSGMPVIAIQATQAEEACGACGSSPCGCETVAEDGPKERDLEYTNTPREETAGIDAAIPSGDGDDRAKKMYSKEYMGDNHMAVKEAIQNMLWNDYQSLINDVKA